MRIPCPFCGERDLSEFTYRGDAIPQRPRTDASEAEIFDYLYLRNNPAGPMHEHWYHAQGCRNWITVTRDTRDHSIFGATLARKGPG